MTKLRPVGAAIALCALSACKASPAPAGADVRSLGPATTPASLHVDGAVSDEGTVDASEGDGGAPDQNSPSHGEPDVCAPGPPRTVEVTVELRKVPGTRPRQDASVVAVVAGRGVPLRVEVFREAEPVGCVSRADPDGRRLRFRCVGDLAETRGEVLWRANRVELAFGSGDYGARPRGVSPGFSVTRQVIPIPCGSTVHFGESQMFVESFYGFMAGRGDALFPPYDAPGPETLLPGAPP